MPRAVLRQTLEIIGSLEKRNILLRGAFIVYVFETTVRMREKKRGICIDVLLAEETYVPMKIRCALARGK